MTSTADTAPVDTDLAQTNVKQFKPWQVLLPYLFILPTFLFIFTFTLWPTASAAIQSLIKPGVTVRQPSTFAGLNNYRELFDPATDIGQRFPRVLANTLMFVAVTVPISIVLAFSLAVMLNRKL